MPASLAGSGLYGALFDDPDTAALFTDSAGVRAMMLVEGALAQVQGDLGMIPADAAAFLHRAGFDLQIDPAGLAAETAINGVPVPTLLAAFRKAAQAPAMTDWLHWGATSQDIMDTALALRFKRLLAMWDARLLAMILALGQLAHAHADLPMAARTCGQAATPTSFGATRFCATVRVFRRCRMIYCRFLFQGRRVRCRPWVMLAHRCAWVWPLPLACATPGIRGMRNVIPSPPLQHGWRGWRPVLARWATT